MKRTIFLLLIFSSSYLTANIINVPSYNHSSIQSAIDSAQTGDTVVVAPGEYFENIVLGEINILLASRYIFEKNTDYIDSTIINGTGNGSVITISSWNDSTLRIIGLTIKNGNAEFGAGIFCKNSYLSLKNLYIINNVIDKGYSHNGAGAGIYFENSFSNLYNVKINNNKIFYGTYSKGAGIYAKNSSIELKSSQIVNNGSGFVNGCGIYLFNTDANIDSCYIFKNRPEYSAHGGGILADSSSLFLNNSTIRDNDAPRNAGGGICLFNMISCNLDNLIIEGNRSRRGGGLYISNSHITAQNITFKNNKAVMHPCYGGGFYLDSTNGDFKNITLEGNQSDSHGAGGFFFKSHPVINEMVVKQNRASQDDGIGGGLYLDSSNPIIKRSLIYGNESASSVGRWGKASAIYCVDSSPYFINTIITENECEYYWGRNVSKNKTYFLDPIAGIQIDGESIPIFINSIIWGNYPQDILDSSGGTSLFFSNIKDSLSGESNIYTNPLFVDSANYDFRLSEDSPCIDAGTSFFVINEDTLINLESSEYFGNAPDIGVYESEYIIGIPEDIQSNLYANFPNPFKTSTFFHFSLKLNSNVRISIFDILGRKVDEIEYIQLPVGEHKIQWKAKNLNSGLYLYSISASDFKYFGKFILIK